MEPTKPDEFRVELPETYIPKGFSRVPTPEEIIDIYDELLVVEVEASGDVLRSGPKFSRFQTRVNGLQSYAGDDATVHAGAMAPAGGRDVDALDVVLQLTYDEPVLQDVCTDMCNGRYAELTPQMKNGKRQQLRCLMEMAGRYDQPLTTVFTTPYAVEQPLEQQIVRFNGGTGVVAEQAALRYAEESAHSGATVIPRAKIFEKRTPYDENEISGMRAWNELGDADLLIAAKDRDILRGYLEQLDANTERRGAGISIDKLGL